MASISFPGIGSGIDATSIADSVYQQYTATNTVRQQKVTDTQSEDTSLEKLRTMLLQVRDSLSGLSSTSGGAAVKSAQVSNSLVASVAAGSAAASGTHTLTVNALASSATASFGTTYASGTSALLSDSSAAGNAQFTVGTGDNATSFSVAVDSTTTLQSFADDFNSQAGGKATATVLNSGTTDNPQYKLMITTSSTGVDSGSLSISADNSALLSSSGLGSTTISQASNAKFTLSGISGELERSSNTVSDILPGMTFQLTGTGTTTVTVSDSASGAAAKVANFVSAYNKAQKFISTEDAVTVTQGSDGTTNTYGSLARTDVDDQAMAGLRDALSSSVSSDGTVSLSSLGISTAEDGSLVFDQTAFETAYSANPTGAAQAVTSLADQLTSAGGSLESVVGAGGSIDSRESANQETITNTNNTIDRVKELAAARQQEVLKQFSILDGLSAKLNSDSSYLSQILSF